MQAIEEIIYYLSKGIELVVIFGLRYVGTRAVGSELYRNSKVVRFTNTLVRLTSNSVVGGRFSLRGQLLRLFFFLVGR